MTRYLTAASLTLLFALLVVGCGPEDEPIVPEGESFSPPAEGGEVQVTVGGDTLTLDFPAASAITFPDGANGEITIATATDTDFDEMPDELRASLDLSDDNLKYLHLQPSGTTFATPLFIQRPDNVLGGAEHFSAVGDPLPIDVDDDRDGWTISSFSFFRYKYDGWGIDSEACSGTSDFEYDIELTDDATCASGQRRAWRCGSQYRGRVEDSCVITAYNCCVTSAGDSCVTTAGVGTDYYNVCNACTYYGEVHDKEVCPGGTCTFPEDAQLYAYASCTCPQGYELEDWGLDSLENGCSDANECFGSFSGGASHDCVDAAQCANTVGSFTCTCPSGQTGDGKASGTGCTLATPCATDNGGCDSNATCANNNGSAQCTCNNGYTGNGQTCTLLNPCDTANGGCDANATCTNNNGTAECACNNGFTGDGQTCAVVNPCDTANGGCDANATCTNNNGTAECACNNGYAGDGQTCAVVNPCDTANGGCDANATCTNNNGAAACACNNGYTGDGQTCAADSNCSAHTDETACNADQTCAWDPMSSVCNDANNSTCVSHFNEPDCNGDLSCFWDPMMQMCLDGGGSMCTGAATQVDCEAGPGCTWDQMQQSCSDDPFGMCGAYMVQAECDIAGCVWDGVFCGTP